MKCLSSGNEDQG